MCLCLVEDHAVADLEPLTLTRPAYALRLGAKTMQMLRTDHRERGGQMQLCRNRMYSAPNAILRPKGAEMAINHGRTPSGFAQFGPCDS